MSVRTGWQRVGSMRMGRWGVLAALGVALACWSVHTTTSIAEEMDEDEVEDPLALIPGSLKDVVVPEPPDLDVYVRDRQAAIALGKALFWDMQLGSRGQACASCHFHAGADSRVRHQLGPGLATGEEMGPLRLDYTLRAEDFPLRKLLNPDDANSPVLRDTREVMSSQGVFAEKFLGVDYRGTVASWRYASPQLREIGSRPANELGEPFVDDVFQLNGKSVRRIAPRRAPSVINAVFNVTQFWDGRASFHFNGASPFGALDPVSTIYVYEGGELRQEKVRIAFASLASQALAPVTSDIEMSFQGRNMATVGRRMLGLRPLARQLVHPDDSVLGPMSRATKDEVGRAIGQPGLTYRNYTEMIQRAFHMRYWRAPTVVRLVTEFQEPFDADPRTMELWHRTVATREDDGKDLVDDEFNQMEANFGLFLGLALQMYEATLVSDDTPFDRYREGQLDALTEQQLLGLSIFVNEGRCVNCHRGAEFTSASVSALVDTEPEPGSQPNNPIELMRQVRGLAFYDRGFYNIGVRPTAEDRGRGFRSPFINPSTGEPYPLSYADQAILKQRGLLPGDVAAYVPDLPVATQRGSRTTMQGAFKTPGLRNVALRGPYFHNGGLATLRQVVDFYARGGDFAAANADDLHVDITPIPELIGNEQRKEALVAFLLALTDERVRWEKAPFDHPQLVVPHGGTLDAPQSFTIPAVGAAGREPQELAPLEPFLGLNPFQP